MDEQTPNPLSPADTTGYCGLLELRALVADITPEEVASPALRRLLEEVRDDSAGCSERTYAYDRTHNKHNRGR